MEIAVSKIKQSTVYEVRDLHPRVAKTLELCNWSYAHEFRIANRGRVDFLAIQRDTRQIAIIECKRELLDVVSLSHQLDSYHVGLGIPAALRVVFSLKASDYQQSQLRTLTGYKLYRVNLSDPVVDRYPNEVEMREFYTLLYQVRGMSHPFTAPRPSTAPYASPFAPKDKD